MSSFVKENKASKAMSKYYPSNQSLFPHQVEAIKFAIKRLKEKRAVYLALDPGLGKTIVAVVLTNITQLRSPKKIFYVCPPSLVANVGSEFKAWGLTKTPTLIPDTKIPEQPVDADLIFVDEAHRFKNKKAGRTKDLINFCSKSKNTVFLSGTPMPNSRPAELWPLLQVFAPDVFGTNFFSFALKYCGAHKTNYGWKFDSFTNADDFKLRLTKSFLLRQKKELLNLPEKREGLLTVGEALPPVVGRLEQSLLKDLYENDVTEEKLALQEGKSSLHLAEYLRLLGLEKLKYVYPFLDFLAQETKENVIIFAHHKDVIKALAKHLQQLNPIVITGETPSNKRAQMVDDFQNGKTRFAILNITAAGVGWNMTQADRVLFVEFSWRDGDNQQAGDRAHRIGRKKPVLVQYVVLKDSFDAKRMSVVLRKRHRAV